MFSCSMIFFFKYFSLLQLVQIKQQIIQNSITLGFWSSIFLRTMSLIDLHICKNSIKSDENSCDICDCPPEYYCFDYCDEGASLSPLISWQHFPRSTSSRSRCDDSSEETAVSVSETITPSLKPEEKESVQVSSTEYPITKSFAQLQALHYLRIRYVFDFLNFLMSHLVCNEPEDPIQFLVDLLNKCLRFRDEFGEPPLLFTHAHVMSLYNAFDPFERGYLTLEQYHAAMTALGLANGPTEYNREPSLNEEGFVNESDFIFQADCHLVDNLKLMLRIPKNWEENRVLWKKRMEKKRIRMKKSFEFDDNIECQEEEEIELSDSSNDKAKDKGTNICYNISPPGMSKLRNEPVQLFLK